MTAWTNDELNKIGNAEELQIASLRRDGTLRKPVIIWVVRQGDDIYIRCVNGREGAWFRGAQTRHAGRIWAGGVEKDVTFVEETDPLINGKIDAAYLEKYRRYPQYVAPMVTPAVRAATIKLVPRFIRLVIHFIKEKNMEYARLGSTGMKVSRICLGCMGFGDAARWIHKWVLDEENSRPIIQKALELGINFFDTANVYSIGASEEILGRALKDFARRDEVVIATKVFFEMSPSPNDRGLSRKHILSSIDASLQRLGTDYVDLYQIHRWDYQTPIEETMEALHDVVKAGKARYIGASAMFAWQFQKALHVAEKHGWTRFVSMQDHLNLIYREEEREMLPLCREEKIGVIPYSPLASGRLTRDGSSESTLRSETDQIAKLKYDATAETDQQIVERVAEVAAKLGVPRVHIALAWLLQKEPVTAPIIGATKIAHLEDALGALSVRLSPEEVAYLEEPYVPHRIVGHQ